MEVKTLEKGSYQENIEYLIYIGCRDHHLQGEIIQEEELRDMVVQFFRREEIDFSVFSAKGGYLSEDGLFISENTLCISLIGPDDPDIRKLAKGLSVFMNQESALIVRDVIKTQFC